MENLWSIVKSFNKFYYATKIVSDKCYLKWIKKMIENEMKQWKYLNEYWFFVFILFQPISAIDCT